MKKIWIKFNNWFFRYKRLKEQIEYLREHKLSEATYRGGLKAQDQKLEILKYKITELTKENSALSRDIATLGAQYKIAADINVGPGREESWAITCLVTKEGPRVEFHDLRGVNGRVIVDFLNQFHASNQKMIDSPYQMRSLFQKDKPNRYFL